MTTIQESVYLLISENPWNTKAVFCTLRTEKKSVKRDKILIFIGMPKKDNWERAFGSSGKRFWQKLDKRERMHKGIEILKSNKAEILWNNSSFL